MTSNPMLSPRVIENVIPTEETASVSGVVNKSIILTLMVVLSASFVWDICSKGYSDKAKLLSAIGAIAGLILCLVTVFKPRHSKITAPMYALCEGLFLGAMSYIFERAYTGIVLNAVCVTLLVMLSMLFLYKTRILRATPTFTKVISISTLAIAVFYFIGFVGSLLGHPMTIFNGGLIGIGVSLLICVIAAFNFIIDFNNIENAANNGMPKYFEWYFGFSILVTLIWLYIEILRLFAQFAERRD